MKPKALVEHIRANQNNNKTLKSLFASQSIEKEIVNRQQAVVDEKIAFLQSLGYKVEK